MQLGTGGRGRRLIGVVGAAALLILGFGSSVGCGDDEAPPAKSTPLEQSGSGPSGAGAGGAPTNEGQGGGGGQANPGPGAEERARRLAVRKATRTYRDYVAAINARDGQALCELIEPGFLKQLRPPGRGACPERLGKAIGFADERGFPVWEETVFEGIESSAVDDRLAVRLTASIVTRFADRPEPSIESDIAYLRPAPAGGYELVRATGALWRAVGKPDVPPGVVAPPAGFESLSGAG